MREGWIGSLGLSASLLASAASAQEMPWRVSGGRPDVAPPAVSLGRPIVDAEPWPVTPAGFRDGPTLTPLASPKIGLGAPQSREAVTAYSPQRLVSAPPDALPPPNPVPPAPNILGGPHLFGCEALGCTTCASRSLFQSDHCFDDFISPVTNPFLFEDPRSLTELRPIGILQGTPHSNSIYRAGDIEFFGMQARVALTERLSVVLSKLGFIWTEPHNGQGVFNAHSGLSEIWLGPKFTFIRNEHTGTVAAGGVIFQLATGPSQVFQDTGRLSVVPYVSVAQGFGNANYGRFHLMSTFGYGFGDQRRTEFFYNSYHLDLDLFNLHKIYPLAELNWYHYASGGDARPINFEGRDLINFGSSFVGGKDSLTLAAGARYKVSENLQTGLAVELPLIGSPDLLNLRLTVDVILRY
jgi:hypothetical protein